MASVRSLKKDIDFLVFEVISDCFTFGAVNPDHEPDKVAEIISDAVILRNDLINRINHPTRDENKKIPGDYYKKIKNDLLSNIDGLFSQLSDLSKGK
ncbi:MAG: hypothetical protein RBR81_09145 [Bacteroidales bacterium]|jgi:hypothetical protein|nr:hypothetical protein [Bacteroidales bacterium]